MTKLPVIEIHEQPTQLPLPNKPSKEPSIEISDEVHAIVYYQLQKTTKILVSAQLANFSGMNS